MIKIIQRPLALSLVERPQIHTERRGGNKAAPKVHVRTFTIAQITLNTAVREWEVQDSCDLQGLARRPVVAHAQFCPGDGHPVRARGAHFWGEMDHAAVVLYVLKLVLL